MVVIESSSLQAYIFGWFDLVQSRFAETPTITLTLNPNFGESGRHRLWDVPRRTD